MNCLRKKLTRKDEQIKNTQNQKVIRIDRLSEGLARNPRKSNFPVTYSSSHVFYITFFPRLSVKARAQTSNTTLEIIFQSPLVLHGEIKFSVENFL